jgi:hypothetical protein
VLFAGQRGERTDTQLREAVRKEGLEGRTTVLGPVPHDEAAALLKGSGAVLLFAGDNRFTRLTKISDAAAVQRPVLAFAAEDSESARHARALGQFVYSSDSAEELAVHLEGLASRPWSAPPSAFPFPFPHPLHWRTAARSLAAQLDRLAPGASPP